MHLTLRRSATPLESPAPPYVWGSLRRSLPLYQPRVQESPVQESASRLCFGSDVRRARVAETPIDHPPNVDGIHDDDDACIDDDDGDT